MTINNAAYFLGLEIKKDSNTKTITISLEQYIKKILKKFGMSDAKTILTPVEANKHLKYLPEDQVDISMKEVPYFLNKQLDYCCLQPVYQDQISCLQWPT